MRRLIIFLVLTGFSLAPVLAQQSLSVTGTGSNAPIVHYGSRNEPPRAIEFNAGTVTPAQFLTKINTYFNIPIEFTFTEAESNTDGIGMRHHLLQQYYKGLPLEGMGYRVHEKAGFITSANGKAVRDINLDMRVTLSEPQAFQQAVRHVHSKDTIVRRGAKLIVSKDFTYTPESFAVAWQFDVDVSLVERWRVSIDARNGELINKVSLVQSCGHQPPPEPTYIKGTGKTSYYGTQSIRIEQSGGTSRLYGQTEHGGFIGTYDFKNAPQAILQLGIPYNPSGFYTQTTTFSGVYERPAVSVHWAAEQAYEYYFLKHNRNSFDNKGSIIKNYVHVDVGLNNAFWTGKLLAYGDGSNNNPLVELDVVSHELTHGVTQYEAGLSYSNEPGALNESFSDIIAKAVEFYTFGDTATWQMARHNTAGGIRDMNNPNLKGQPDTYAGNLWYTGTGDYGGVHTNSGVQNFWFYLLCKGGSGVNDRQESYAINAIGMAAATDITYRNLTEYLSASSDYLDSRIGSLLAVADLYGKNSTIYQQVDKAWDAVGVIDEPIIQTFERYDILATTVKVKGTMLPRGDNATYHFEYGTTPAYGNATSPVTYVDKIEGIITGLQSQTKYYLRLVATNANGSSYATTEFTTISLAPLVKITPTIDITETTATLHGQVNPNSLATSFYFEYGLTPALGMVTPTYPLGNASEFLAAAAAITGLQPRQTYYYRLVATNSFASINSETRSLLTAVKPIILSFMPSTGAIGTEVTITGQNFNAAPGKNLVSFGATRSEVLSASPNEIKVKVPAGATFGPLSILDVASGLADQSAQEFVPTFAEGYKKGDLQLRTGFTPDDDITQTVIQDMDGDGKPDIFGCSYSAFTIFLNVNQGGDITENSFVQNTYNVTNLATEKFLADMDGNGLKDVVAKYANGVRIYPNKSVPGYIFFDPPVDIPLGSIWNITLNDFDQDGRIDIAGSTSQLQGDSQFAIFRNKNAPGILSANGFEQLYSLEVLPPYIYFLTTSDLNNDGAIDVLFNSFDLVTSSNNQNIFQILQNNSLPGVPSFEQKTIQDPSRGQGATSYTAHDLNGDERKEILSTARSNASASKLTVWEGPGATADITLNTPEVIFTDNTLVAMATGDVTGDSKPELLISTTRGTFKILENISTTGQPLTTSSFKAAVELGQATPATASDVSTKVTVGDLNGDGRPDIILIYDLYHKPEYGYQMQIWQNSPPNCIDPSGIKINTSGTTAQIDLPPNTTIDDFEIDYSLETTGNWQRAYAETISNLSAGAAYQLRVRAKCYLGYTDYAHIDFAIDCIDVSDVSITSISDMEATVNSAYLYNLEIQYAVVGQDRWSDAFGNRLFALLPGTTYNVRYRGKCTDAMPFQYKQFTTVCTKLSGITISNLTSGQATITWTNNYGGPSIIQFSADNTMWTSIDWSTRTLTGLLPGKIYFVRGWTDCPDNDSEVITTTFTTPKLITSTDTGVYPHEATTFSPNPADREITLHPSKDLIGNHFSIYDNMGRTVADGKLADYTLDVSGFSPGVYTLKIDGEKAMRIVKR